MGGVGEVVGGEDERLGEPARAALVLVGVALHLLQDAAVGRRCRHARLHVGCVELALVFQKIKPFGARLWIDQPHLLALLEEDAVHAHTRLDGDGVVVDKVALSHGPLVLVAVGHLLEVGRRVRRRRGRQPDLDGIEMFECAPPHRDLGRCVPPVALVGDHKIEGVNRNAELGGIFVWPLVRRPERSLLAEEVNRHALDRRDIDEGVPRLRVFEVRRRQNHRIERLVLAEVLALEALAVDLVDAVELQPRLGFVGPEGAHGLGGKRPPVHKEKHAADEARSHKTVNKAHRHKRLPRPCRHRYEEVPLPLAERLFDGRVGFPLVGPHHRMGWNPVQRFARRLHVVSEALGKGFGRVEASDHARAVHPIPHIAVPDRLAVRGVEERDSEAVEIEGAIFEPMRVALRLGQHAHRPYPRPLRLDHTHNPASNAKHVVRRPGLCRVLLDSAAVVAGERRTHVEWHDMPPRCL